MMHLCASFSTGAGHIYMQAGNADRASGAHAYRHSTAAESDLATHRYFMVKRKAM